MDTIEYIQMNNYVRAQECCNQTADLAQSLHDKKMQTETGICLKLIEAVIAADELMSTGEYSQAQSGYREAAIRARYADNLGLDYINDQLARTAGYISVYDYIYLGDSLAEKRLYDAAEEKYLEARAQAARLYFDKGRDAAVSALDKLYEDKEEEKAAKEEERQEQLAAEDSAANYVTQGDTAYAQGDYESAKVHYVGALQKYEELGMSAEGSHRGETCSSRGKVCIEGDTGGGGAGLYCAGGRGNGRRSIHRCKEILFAGKGYLCRNER